MDPNRSAAKTAPEKSAVVFSMADLLWISIAVATACGYMNIHGTVTVANLGGTFIYASICIGIPVLIMWFASLSKCETGPQIIVSISTITGVLFWFYLKPLIGWYTPLLFAALLIAFYAFRHFEPRPSLALIKGVASSLVFAIFLGMQLDAFWPTYRVARLLEAREAFPVVDISDRIAMPFAPVPLPSKDKKEQDDSIAETIKFNEDVNSKYSEASVPWGRTFSLKRLHDANHERFIRAQGFGMIRMPFLGTDHLDYAALEDTAFDSRTPNRWNLGIEDDLYLNVSQPLQPTDQRTALKQLYSTFFPEASLGNTLEKGKSVGFEPHGFRQSVGFKLVHDTSPQTGTSPQTAPETYELKKLELISILKHSPSRAYVLDHLPRMDQLSSDDAVTRELTLFEQRSMERLIAGETLVVDDSGDTLKMVGALRAIDQCNDCHSSQKHDLLGAFTYEFESTDNGFKMPGFN